MRTNFSRYTFTIIFFALDEKAIRGAAHVTMIMFYIEFRMQRIAYFDV